MGVLQPWHLIIVLVIVLLIFGPGKLPLLGKAIGDSLRDFKKSVGSDEQSTASAVEMAPGMRACPHCNLPMTKLRNPDAMTAHWQCANEECPAPSRPHIEFDAVF